MSMLIPILSADKPGSNRIDEDVLLIQSITSPRELNEYVILESSMYRTLFGKKKIASNRSRKRLSIVRISYDGRSIHRAYRSIPARNFTKDYVGLTPDSISELSDGTGIPALSEVTLGKGCWWNSTIGNIQMQQSGCHLGWVSLVYQYLSSWRYSAVSLIIFKPIYKPQSPKQL